MDSEQDNNIAADRTFALDLTADDTAESIIRRFCLLTWGRVLHETAAGTQPVIDLSQDDEDAETVELDQDGEAADSDSSRTRYRFTLWCHTVTRTRLVAMLMDLRAKCKYFVVGLELSPTTKRTHWQGFLVLKKKTRFNQLRTGLLQSCHILTCEKTNEANVKYCTKDQQYLTFGELPNDHGGDRERKRWKAARDLAVAGTLDEIEDDHIYVSCYRSLQAISAAHPVRHDTVLDEYPGILLYGVPNSGKSRKARAMFPPEEVYIKPLNKWVCGALEKPYWLMEDVSPSTFEYLKDYLKQWLDIYPFSAEIKGSSTILRPVKIIMTSNYSLKELTATSAWSDADRMAIRRRFSLVEYFPFEWNSPQSAAQKIGDSIYEDMPDGMSSVNGPKPTFVTPVLRRSVSTVESIDEASKAKRDEEKKGE